MVDQANNKCRVDNMVPEPLMNQVIEVKEIFEEELSFSHVYREFNVIVDQLSKESLLLHESNLFEQDFRGGTQVSASKRPLYFLDT